MEAQQKLSDAVSLTSPAEEEKKIAVPATAATSATTSAVIIDDAATVQSMNESVASLASSISRMDASEIEDIFRKYDVDKKGELDTFKLSNAIADLMNRVPTTVQVVNMIAGIVKDAAESAEGIPLENNALDFEQFTRLCKHFDWESNDFLNCLQDSMYEIEFSKPQLGFRVKNVQARGLIVVSKVEDPELEGKIKQNDTIVAVNGAPLGYVTDHKVLAEKIKSLGRPLKMTFERWSALQKVDEVLLTVNNLTVEEVHDDLKFEQAEEIVLPSSYPAKVPAPVLARLLLQPPRGSALFWWRL